MADYFNPKFGSVVRLGFHVSNVDTGQANVDLSCNSQIGTLLTMPYSGSVVGLAVKANANVTAGTVAFAVHKDSTEYPDQSQLSITLTTAAGSSNKGYGTVRPNVLRFSAGDGMGVSVSSATNLAATTVDYNADLYVVFDPL